MSSVLRTARRTSLMSCPSMGPRYAKPSASKSAPGTNHSDLVASRMCPPSSLPPGRRESPFSTSSRMRLSVGSTLARWKSLESAPTFSEMLMPLSFSTTVMGEPSAPAWFRPS